VLHDRADVGGLTVAECVDIDLDRALEEAVDERWPLHPLECGDDLLLGVAHAHRAAAEDI